MSTEPRAASGARTLHPAGRARTAPSAGSRPAPPAAPSRLRRAAFGLAAVPVAVALACSATGPAHAAAGAAGARAAAPGAVTADPTAPPDEGADGADGAATAPGRRIADALRRSPVYVDPAYEQAFPVAEQRKLAAKIKKSGIPVRVVVVPFVTGDAWGGEPEKMVEVVRDRLGESPRQEAVYMTLSRTEGYLSGHEFPRDGEHQAFWGVAAVGHQDDMDGKSLYAKFSRALEIVEAGNGDKVYEKATADLPRTPVRDEPGGPGGTSWTLVAALAGAALAVLLAALLGYRALRRRAGGSARTPFTSPRSVFAAARTADADDLRERAQRELLAYHEDVLAHEPGEGNAHPDGDATAHYQLALDAYDAAGRVLDGARGVPDLAGVLALVHEGRGALGRAATARRGRRRKPGTTLPLCFFHPLHGPADRRVRWRPLGRREALHVAACTTCAAAVAAHRAPEVLTQTHGDREIPYFEVPPAQSLWARTGYGSLGETTLTTRVLRGEFSRSGGRAATDHGTD
ncbi:hypothetical protein HMPREF1486_06564 [Streptomyces sp. HPH0547]|nr:MULTISPECIES: hypothetical protein [Streptomyces]EPD89244.1 hypothetical protein HMPREF1486_06564 [Streptomyces sp. HPH0547]UVN55260.1 hypothetical protein NR995_12555 [Streptomyces albus]